MADTQFKLEVPGVGAAKVKVLIEAGYTSLHRLAMAKVTELKELDGIGETIALKIIGVAQDATGIGAPRKASDVYADYVKERRALHTGSKVLNLLLGGGFHAGWTYEIAGKNGHGKSQMVCQLLANAITPKAAGGWEGTAYLIDTENTSDLLSKRLRDMVLGNGVPEEDLPEVMARCEMVKAPNSECQINVVRRLLENNKRYDLLIVDGVMTKFRAEFIGRANLSERQGLLSDHLDDLNVYADLHKSLVVFTNQVSDSPELYGGTYAIGGNVVGHSSKYRLMVRKSKENKRVVRLDKAGDLPEGEAVFLLTSEGIADVPNPKGE